MISSPNFFSGYHQSRPFQASSFLTPFLLFIFSLIAFTAWQEDVVIAHVAPSPPPTFPSIIDLSSFIPNLTCFSRNLESVKTVGTCTAAYTAITFSLLYMPCFYSILTRYITDYSHVFNYNA